MLTLGCGEEFVLELFDNEEFVAIVAITMGCITGMVALLSTGIAGVLKTRARETTKRDVAAFVAEGSISAHDAVAMLNADRPNWEAGVAEQLLGKRT
jgi:uncharacterized membrane protein YcjF (UPF0283 family)